MSKKSRTLQGGLFRAANGRNSYEIFYASPEIIPAISRILVSEFGCSRPSPPVIGLDEVITGCRKGEIELLLGWDNWSGFYIMADSEAGDSLVEEIGHYLDTVITGKEFEKYVQD